MPSVYAPQALALAYLEAKREVILAGFGSEIDWQENLSLQQLTETAFLREATWVVLSAGMREKVIRNRFPQIADAFLHWHSGRLISDQSAACRTSALSVINHSRKIDSILIRAQIVADEGFPAIYGHLTETGVDYLKRFPFIGPATSRHLAKNIGIPVAKPDRHLKRMAAHFCYSSPDEFCADIALLASQSVPVVDLVLWRFATLHRAYIERLSTMCQVAESDLGVPRKGEHSNAGGIRDGAPSELTLQSLP
jgi:hypothetical protein